MYQFRNDYSVGAHPLIMDALVRTNLEPTPGYGEDEYCAEAADAIRQRFSCSNADVHFLVGGTQTNFISLTAFLRPWEAVIAVDTAHIAVHEAGAVEARGHKVIPVPNADGKLTPEALRKAYIDHTAATPGHMVVPKLVYVSDTTEIGTVYKKAELMALRTVCDELGLYLYMDGARLASAMTASDNDLVPEDLPSLFDAFYIGGTKCGLLFGEALVIVNSDLKPYYRYLMKQSGALLAKGRLLGVQFKAFLQNDLWLSMGRHENEMAEALVRGLTEKGYRLLSQSPTNQVFAILPKEKIHQLEENFTFEFVDFYDDTHDVVRFVTAWETPPQAVDALIAAL